MVNAPGEPHDTSGSTPEENHPSAARALHILESSAYAPRCPHGHGPLVAQTDDNSPIGMALSCPACGSTRALEVTMLSNLLATGTRDNLDVPLEFPADAPAPDTPDPAAETGPAENEITTEIPAISEPVPAGAAAEPPAVSDALWKSQPDAVREVHDTVTFEALPAVTPPAARGLQPDGTIRTTGWLQAGKVPISSGIWAALAGLAAATALLGVSVWAVLIAAVSWGAWKIATRWIWPASVAVNRRQLPAAEIEPGMCVRLHGPIGPVAVVGGISQARRDRVRLHLAGGGEHILPSRSLRHVVDLRT